MTTVAHGPYEHVGAYGDLAESEVFDTSGTPVMFCIHCEHSPCVAGGGFFCTMDPRFITAEHYSRGAHEALERLPRMPAKPLMVIAIDDLALRKLVILRSKLRRAVRQP